MQTIHHTTASDSSEQTIQTFQSCACAPPIVMSKTLDTTAAGVCHKGKEQREIAFPDQSYISVVNKNNTVLICIVQLY